MYHSAGDTVKQNTHEVAEADATSEWWERYLFVLPVMAAVGAVGLYFLNTNRDLAGWVLAWLLITFAVMLFVQTRVSATLDLYRFRAVTFLSNGTPIVRQRRKYLGFLLGASLSMVALVILDMLLGFFQSHAWDTVEAWDTIVFLLATLITSIIALLVFIALWPRDGTALDSFFDRGPGILVALAVLIGLWVGSDKTIGLAGAVPLAAPAASWEKQLEFVRQKAAKIDKDAVITNIEAEPFIESGILAPKPYGPQTPFKVYFDLAGISGKQIHIGILDVDPPRLISLDQSVSNSPPSQETLQQFSQRLATVKLSPRDVYVKTFEQGARFQEEHKGSEINIQITMSLTNGWQAQFGVPAGWELDYFANFTYIMQLKVDGATGRVLARYDRSFSEATPTAIPFATATTIPSK